MEADLGRPLLEPETRSPDPAVCPFLRAADGTRFVEPVGSPDAANRCLAAGPAVPRDLDWQASTCLTARHVSCARYLLGSAAAGAVDAGAAGGEGGHATPPAAARTSRTMTPAILLALAFLVTSAAAAVTFVAATGGLELATTAPSAVAFASPSPTSPQGATASPASTSGATPAPTPVVSASPAPTLPPTAAPTPAATSNRYALLTPCPSKPDCYLYTIRRGDNLQSIANYFGVPYSTVLSLNPRLSRPIQPGEVLTLPPPTR